MYGASPETTDEEIKAAFVETGIGEVIEASRGLLDPKRVCSYIPFFHSCRNKFIS